VFGNGKIIQYPAFGERAEVLEQAGIQDQEAIFVDFQRTTPTPNASRQPGAAPMLTRSARSAHFAVGPLLADAYTQGGGEPCHRGA
jgi:hypothetical protein